MKNKPHNSTTEKAPGGAAFYTINEFAEHLNVSPKSVRRLIKQRKLAAHLFGRLWRISQPDALAFERANRIS